jgi:hypothetical protein
MTSSLVLLSEWVLYVVDRGEIGDVRRRRWYPCAWGWGGDERMIFFVEHTEDAEEDEEEAMDS